MRDPLSRFSAPMQTFLKDKPVTLPTPPSNAGALRNPRRRGGGVTNHTANSGRGHGLSHPGQGSSQEDDVGVSLLL